MTLRTVAVVIVGLLLACAVLTIMPRGVLGEQSTYLPVNSAPCEDFMDIVQLHNGTTEWLVNEKQPLDGYSLYSSKFFPSYADMWAYTSAVKSEFMTCDWYADADATTR